MFLEEAHHELSWPSREEVLRPKGEGAVIFADLVREKIGRTLERLVGPGNVEVGLLASDQESTTAPLAIVCEFAISVPEDTLVQAQKLAWNFGLAPLLITIEPHVVRKWSCYELPVQAREERDLLASPEIEPSIPIGVRGVDADSAASSLHWVELLTGQFFSRHQNRFEPDTRADHCLLGNLKDVRRRLLAMGLSDDVSHDLLARIIFIQFLFDRKDSSGKAVLDSAELVRLAASDHLSQAYENFGDLLANYEDTYALFKWLNGVFNGDLFPGKGTTAQQAAAWEAERRHVQPEHLALLGRFVSGREAMLDGQPSLWPHYAFDAIPLDLISTIYEQFVRKEEKMGVHYTPPRVVDLMLDSVLPWAGTEWDLKVLDPACGSGVFLVKTFHRLIRRWKNAHAGQRITGEDLSRILENNIFGADKDPHAVRVASFSLYLALCDEIDPRDYWREVRFPILRGRRLIAQDFFDETSSSVKIERSGGYDLVVGNPPWGKDTAGELALAWAKAHGWPVSYKDIGPVFLARALSLLKAGGRLALLQPAGSLLYNGSAPARKLRARLFREATVESLINLAAYRRYLFADAQLPVCAIIATKTPSESRPITYVCPKPVGNSDDWLRISIEELDIHTVMPEDVDRHPWIWSTLLWGGYRDVELINKLRRLESPATLKKANAIASRQGIIRGKARQRDEAEILDRRLVTPKEFPDGFRLRLDARVVPINRDPKLHWKDSVDFTSFEQPQLLIRRNFPEHAGRFRAAIVDSPAGERGVLCNDSFLNLHGLGEEGRSTLEAICLALNSRVAVYYLLLTSGRFAMDRNQPQSNAFMEVPVPKLRGESLYGVETINELDARADDAYRLNEAERGLVADMVRYTLPDYRIGDIAPGRTPTRRTAHEDVEPDLTVYCTTLAKVLQAAYGERPFTIVVYHEPDGDALPVRMVSVFLGGADQRPFLIEPLGANELRNRLSALYRGLLNGDRSNSFYKRSLRGYGRADFDGTQAIRIDLVKPDQVRLWSGSAALSDGDAIAADLATWAKGTSTSGKKRVTLA